jgi:hypothetical protein
VHLELRGDVTMQADGHRELANRLDWLVEMNLPLVDFEALGGERLGDVGGRD